jgi:sugar lactone lactonase YvrE
MQVEQLTGPIAYHGEGAVWSPKWGGLRWVDMLAGDVLFLAEDGSVKRRHVDTVAAAIRPRRSGGAVIGGERQFLLEEPDGIIRQLDQLWSDTGVRMNEGGCDPNGRFYCGSMAYDQSPNAAKLFRLDPDLTVHTVLTGVTVSNGLDWSADGSLAYHNDTATFSISVFNYSPDAGLTIGVPLSRLPIRAGPMALPSTLRAQCGRPSPTEAWCTATPRQECSTRLSMSLHRK